MGIFRVIGNVARVVSSPFTSSPVQSLARPVARFAFGESPPTALPLNRLVGAPTMATLRRSSVMVPFGDSGDPYGGRPITLPPPTGGSRSQSFGETIGGELVNIGLDWLKNKIIPGNPSAPLVPVEPNPIPQGSCPEGQIGFPPACFDLQPGGGTQGGGMYIGYGEAIMGRYGAGIQPAVRAQQVRSCPPGAVLGNDGICYNKRDLRRADRKWVPGRKPLLTGGDLNAISRANRAANKLKAQQKRLQKMGMLAKPAPRRGRAVSPARGQGAFGPVQVIDT